MNNTGLPQHVTSAPSVSISEVASRLPLQAFLPVNFTAKFVVPAQ